MATIWMRDEIPWTKVMMSTQERRSDSCCGICECCGSRHDGGGNGPYSRGEDRKLKHGGKIHCMLESKFVNLSYLSCYQRGGIL